MNRIKRKKLFIRELAEFLVDNQAGKSISLQVEGERPSILKWPLLWQRLRGATPLFGYPTVEEAEKELTEFLG